MRWRFLFTSIGAGVSCRAHSRGCATRPARPASRRRRVAHTAAHIVPLFVLHFARGGRPAEGRSVLICAVLDVPAFLAGPGRGFSSGKFQMGEIGPDLFRAGWGSADLDGVPKATE